MCFSRLFDKISVNFAKYLYMTQISLTDDQYAEWLAELKTKIQQSRLKATLSVNRELILLYWQIGQDIIERQQQYQWGDKVLDTLAKDLRIAFPEIKGFSKTNLKYMRLFAQAWDYDEIGQQAVDQLPWGHNIRIFTDIKDKPTRIWYIKKTIEFGWSRKVLVHQIETQAHLRLGNAQNNFADTLPNIQSELVRDIFKDPYHFEFLDMGGDVNERQIEQGLINRLKQFLIELGVGFAFVGSQYHLEVGGEDFYIDLLFYHIKLHCYVVIELKNTDFKPEYSGKLNFYVSVVDDLIKDKAIDKPTIGLILCKGKNNTIAEYALQGIQKPIGVATYITQTSEVPTAIADYLPSIEALTEVIDTPVDNNVEDISEDN